jgi:hypothetical protein
MGSVYIMSERVLFIIRERGEYSVRDVVFGMNGQTSCSYGWFRTIPSARKAFPNVRTIKNQFAKAEGQ